MKALNCNSLLKCFGSAGILFHTFIIRSEKNVFVHVDAVVMRDQFIQVTACGNDCFY